MKKTRLDVPYHRQDKQDYCGAATAQMAIVFREAVLLEQDSDIKTLIRKRRNRSAVNIAANWATDPTALSKALNELSPSWGTYEVQTASTSASLNRHFVESIVDLGEAPIVLIDTGDHWVLLRGCQTKGDEIVAFFVHDPWPGFEEFPYTTPHDDDDACSDEGQPDLHVTYEDWHNWFKPVDVKGTWNGKYVAVCVSP